MKDSCGSRKRTRSSAAVKIGASSSDRDQNMGNVKNFNNLPHLVVGEILQYLEVKDLLQCSLVNKFWNHEARRLLREKHECALTIDLDRKSAKDIMNFGEKLATSELPLPYRSLSIKREKYKALHESLMIWRTKKLEPAQIAIKDLILYAGPFKVVQLNFQCNTEFEFEAWFTQNVLAEVHGTVECLQIKNLDGGNLFSFVKRFPELKKLEVELDAIVGPRDINKLQNLVNDSPKLETVGCLSSRWLQLLKKLPQTRKLAVVKEFTCVGMYKYQAEVSKFADMGPKLEKLYIPRGSDYCPYPASSCPMRLLSSSQSSLIELHAPYEILEKVFRLKPSFVKLRRIRVYTSWYEAREMITLYDDIVSLCPKLEKLQIQDGS